MLPREKPDAEIIFPFPLTTGGLWWWWWWSSSSLCVCRCVCVCVCVRERERERERERRKTQDIFLNKQYMFISRGILDNTK